MRRLVTFSILLAVAGLGTVVFVISAAASKRQPAIQVVTGQTAVKVAGKGFAPGERVTLRATASGEQYVAKTRANVRGAFMATLADETAIETCGPLTVTAAGARGSRATAVRRPSIAPPCGIVIQP
jgi:hypothetical protein